MSSLIKFTCVSKTETQHWQRNKGMIYSYKFTPVTSGSPENDKFFEATPTGTIEIGVVKDGSFEVGKTYFFEIRESGI